MEALRLAVLDQQLHAQLSEVSSGLDDVEVVWAGTDIERFQREVPEKKPDAIAVDLEALGEDAPGHVEQLMRETGAETALVLYTFARRNMLHTLAETRARPLRAPISLTNLRGVLSGLIVRKILSDAPKAAFEPRYSVVQLGRLKEIESSIECECPAHVADLLTELGAFERYSANCANRDDEDQRIHQMLFEETGKARVIMEKALARLLEHEKIDI
jgi:hypothetical protein